MNRRKSREITMQLLFEMTINKEDYKEILNTYKENSETNLNDVDFSYVERIIKCVQENLEDIDKSIQTNLKNWKLNRLSKIDLTILRIATCEVLYMSDIPDKVSVNEAIELSKRYSSDNSPSFINGVLGNMIRTKNN